MNTKLHFLTFCCLVAFASMAQANQEQRLSDVDRERVENLQEKLAEDSDDEPEIEPRSL